MTHTDFNTVLADAIRDVLGGRDGSYPLPAEVLPSTGDVLGEFEAYAALADKLDMDISEVTSQSWFDVVQRIVVSIAHTETVKLKVYLLEQGRHDLLEPWLAIDPPDEAPY